MPGELQKVSLSSQLMQGLTVTLDTINISSVIALGVWVGHGIVAFIWRENERT